MSILGDHYSRGVQRSFPSLLPGVNLMRTFLCALVLVSGAAHAAGEQTGTVTFDYGQYSSGPSSAGLTFFTLQGGTKLAIPVCNNFHDRWVINNNWPAAKIQIAI